MGFVRHRKLDHLVCGLLVAASPSNVSLLLIDFDVRELDRHSVSLILDIEISKHANRNDECANQQRFEICHQSLLFHSLNARAAALVPSRSMTNSMRHAIQ
jgi:hypothetical protein